MKRKIVATVDRLLTNSRAYKAMASAVNPYGDGLAAKRTVGAIKRYFGMSKARVNEFVPARRKSR